MTTRVLIIYNEPSLPADHPDSYSECEVLETVAQVERVLGNAKFGVRRLGIGRDPAPLIETVRRDRPDVVFNLYEGLADWGDTEIYCISLLEWLRVPFTGCPLRATCLSRDKALTKDLLRSAGLPTAQSIVIHRLPVPQCRLRWPVIVKPANQDASVGIAQDSVVETQSTLEARVALMLERYGPPVLVEEYIAGREFCVGLFERPELTFLPIAEYEFRALDGVWPIITYEGKWTEGTRDYDMSPMKFPAENVSPQLAERLRDVADRTYRLFGCRDYARLDFRVNDAGEPFVLELNTNPGLNPEAGFALGLQSMGLSWDSLVLQLVRNALGRGGYSSDVIPSAARNLHGLARGPVDSSPRSE
jgi:D-alanine-D-alanine ligase